MEDLINFIKIFKWENMIKEVSHEREFTSMLPFHVIKEAQC